MSALCALLLVPALWFAQLVALYALEPTPALLPRSRGEQRVEDARGGLLRESPDGAGQRARWVPLDRVPEAFLSALIESEDHHFERHLGVDPMGVMRALWLDVRAGRVVAGGSTLAMQLARELHGLSHGPLGKIEQAARAIALQLRLGRRGVLEAYVNVAPFGRDLRGVAAASRAYFGKPLRDLTRGEAIALACLPRAPSRYDPYRHADRLRARRAHVLGLLMRRGRISGVERTELAREPLSLAPFARSFRAPHATALAQREASARGGADADRIVTTLEPMLQEAAKTACARAVRELRGAQATGCAAVVLRVSTAEVLALVGSPDFHGEHAGQVNAAIAPRQPGSALKPFLYALAFEHGKRPAELIVDEPTRFPAAFGDFVPENYDHRFHGAVTLRRALACSYNVPAVKLAYELGPARLLARLRALGLDTLERGAEHYGVGLALGDGEVTLLALTSAYAALARGGVAQAPTLLKSVSRAGAPLPLPERARRRVFTASAAHTVSDVLADGAARRPAFGESSVLELPFAAAVKTGTSSDYRDNWALGYAADYAVGVWVGRHDGASLQGVSGVSGAGPAFRHLMLSAVDERRGLLARSDDLTD